MSFYYPQACLKLRILLEDFHLVSDAAKQIPYTLLVVARNVTVNVSDYKSCNTFSADIDYKNFPFDPRSIRACGVTVFLQDMGSAQTLIEPTNENALLAGFVDEEGVSFDDSKRQVHFDGRDFTALLIDQKYNENTPINEGQPLDQAVQVFLNKIAAVQKLKIINNTGSPLPVIAQYSPGFVDPLGGMKNPGVKQSYWEIIQDLSNRAGLICYIHLDQLIFSTPRNQFDSSSDLKIIYGQNIKRLSYKRRLGRYKGFNLLVRSRYRDKVYTALIPEEATKEWGEAFGFQYQPGTAATGGTPTNFAPVSIPVLKADGTIDPTQLHTAPYISFPIPNISNKEQLIRIGQSTYEEFSRQQLEGIFETSEMLGHSGVDPSDPNFKAYDLTGGSTNGIPLEIGQPICLEIATDDLSRISRLKSIHDRVQYLLQHGYDYQVASLFASTMGKFSPRMYTKSYSVTLNQDTGFSLHVDFINIIELKNRGFTDIKKPVDVQAITSGGLA